MQKSVPSWAKISTFVVISRMPNGWSKVLEKKTYYDPETKSSKYVSSKVLGKLPPKTKDLDRMIPTERKHHPYSRKMPISSKTGQEAFLGTSVACDPSALFFALVMAGVLDCMNQLTKISWPRSLAALVKTNRELFPSKRPISNELVRMFLTMLGCQRRNISNLIKLFTAQLFEKASPVFYSFGLEK